MVELQLPKLAVRVRFPLPAPIKLNGVPCGLRLVLFVQFGKNPSHKRRAVRSGSKDCLVVFCEDNKKRGKFPLRYLTSLPRGLRLVLFVQFGKNPSHKRRAVRSGSKDCLVVFCEDNKKRGKFPLRYLTSLPRGLRLVLFVQFGKKPSHKRSAVRSCSKNCLVVFCEDNKKRGKLPLHYISSLPRGLRLALFCSSVIALCN